MLKLGPHPTIGTFEASLSQDWLEISQVEMKYKTLFCDHVYATAINLTPIILFTITTHFPATLSPWLALRIFYIDCCEGGNRIVLGDDIILNTKSLLRGYICINNTKPWITMTPPPDVTSKLFTFLKTSAVCIGMIERSAIYDIS